MANDNPTTLKIAAGIILAAWGAVSYHLANLWASILLVQFGNHSVSGSKSLNDVAGSGVVFRDYAAFHVGVMSILFAIAYLAAAVVIVLLLRIGHLRFGLASTFSVLVGIAVVGAFTAAAVPVALDDSAWRNPAVVLLDYLAPAAIAFGGGWLALRWGKPASAAE